MESEKLLTGRVSSDSSFEDLDLGYQTRTRRSRRAQVGKWALRILVAWLSIWSIFNISTKLWKTFHKPQRVSCACGSSFAEARALNCRFDSLASAWLRPACIDEDLTSEFNRAGPEPDGSWIYYTDFNKTGTYTLDQIASLADTGIYYYNTQAWHLAHCTFNWRKAIRSKWTGVVMEARSDTEEHVNHCEAMFKSRLPLEYVGVVSAITFDADWAGLKHKMHEMHTMHMHEDSKSMHGMHDSEEMHPEDSKSMHEMHQSNDMHEGNMHEMHQMHETDSKSMHGDMHPDGAMHKSTEEMHPQGGMMHDMHGQAPVDKTMHASETNMHPSKEMHSSEMHPSKEMHENMHSTEMHPTPNMHGESMHPEMHPTPDMHGKTMHADMHPESSTEGAMHPTELA